ncbi:para-nitrobenzyl esterase [Stackebrandtia albiflava]|uniref:Para-nitrobenzyl esterase n=1 Tax=Stackebrandtia albiflava TaxID=406432 RepID=A0A562VCJ7_9ACTN|nr:carboxylesterase family protein [Stackebrandtia albiflava]TWJ15606.1 para-nitrobenzyl esterase [Stackebrandtia albiflava]
MRRGRTTALVVTAVVALLAAGTALAERPEENRMARSTVHTDAGVLRGTVADDHRSFEGIPYAAAPKGELRWRPPQPVKPWRGVRDATSPGSPCPQTGTPYGGEEVLEEDCLYLNVTTPVSGPRDKPVVVWIHGNGTIGSGDVFDARRLATRGDVVVVTINYRMGVFGAFGHPELPESGVLGLRDQRAALQWVQRNAEAFGGDPSNVTLFGVSFGATAISGHMMSPESHGLFHRAILHSGFTVMDAPSGAIYPFLEELPRYGWTTDAQVRETGAAVAAELGCGEASDVMACLRAKPVKELLAYPSVMNIFQSYALGSAELPGDPATALAAGEFARVPVLAGSTLDEHRTMVAIRVLSGYPIEDATQYTAALRQAFGEDAEAVEREYPFADYRNGNEAFAQVMTDRMWARATLRQHTALAGHTEVYAYEFADRNPPQEFPFPPEVEPGAYHNADISYLFRDPEFEAELSPAQLRLSDTMIDYWTAFARNGDPRTPGAPEWERFDTTGTVLGLAPGDGGIAPVDFAAEHRLEFWERMP